MIFLSTLHCQIAHFVLRVLEENGVSKKDLIYISDIFYISDFFFSGKMKKKIEKVGFSLWTRERSEWVCKIKGMLHCRLGVALMLLG